MERPIKTIMNIKKLEEIYKEKDLKDEELKESLAQALANMNTEIEDCKEKIAIVKLKTLEILKYTSFDTSVLIDNIETQKIQEERLGILLELKKQLF